MSRTKKGQKGSGYEYWGRRFQKMRDPGPETKKITHQHERARAKQQIAKTQNNNE